MLEFARAGVVELQIAGCRLQVEIPAVPARAQCLLTAPILITTVLADGHRAKSQSTWMSNFWSRQMFGPPKSDWKLAESRVPLRLGKPLPLIPFVFHGPRNALPDVDKMPLADIIYVNLDHYRLDADYKHGLHSRRCRRLGSVPHPG